MNKNVFVQIVGFFGLFVNWELKILLVMLYYFYTLHPEFLNYKQT